MLTNTGPVAKFYFSIIDDVIESIRELFLDEGLEDRLVDDLRHLWESKMMQSKAMEDLRKGNANPSNFVLQLPANYRQADQEVAASVMIPSSQNIHSFPRLKYNSETLATFSLPAGLAYPVQIPAGVTLQTASGQRYKVNVPVVVTQTAAGQQPAAKHTHRISAWKEAAGAPPCPSQHQTGEPSSVRAPSVTQAPNPGQSHTSLASSQESSLPGLPPVPPAEAPQRRQERSPGQPVASGESEPSSQPATNHLPCSQVVDLQSGAEEPCAQTEPFKSSNIDDILKRVIEEERAKAERARAAAKADSQADDVLRLVYSYSELSDIVQLDGPADNSDSEGEEERAALEENDFLGMINAEAIKALQEGEASSDGTSGSTSGDSADELTNVEEEDPLNSGDDVIEQDIPDLFDTDNVIVCQYDKIHRSKNRWKFHLKDGVMCYGGRDYVFSKAVGEAEW